MAKVGSGDAALRVNVQDQPSAAPPSMTMKQRIKKAYGWLSGIVVAFLATYITAVLAAVIPAPKDMLCKLSLGFCPKPESISFWAVDSDYIVDRRDVAQAVSPNQIGMLHNSTIDMKQRPNMVKYRIPATVAGSYELRIFYAANEQRPVELIFNDQTISDAALVSTTGGWDNENRKWSDVYPVTVVAGDNYLLIKRDQVFPHLSKVKLVQVLK